MRRANNRSVWRCIAGALLDLFEKTEIADFQVPFGSDEEVVGLDIPMQDRTPMGILQSLQRLAKPTQTEIELWRPLPRQPASQVASRHVFHGHPTEHAVARIRRGAGCKDLDNVGTTELGQD